MAKNLIQQVMMKTEKDNDNCSERAKKFDSDALVKIIQGGYLEETKTKYQKKKTFAPSTLTYNHGECARYWYLAFEGGDFEDNSDAYGVANRTSGTLSHGRIEKALKDSGILINSEFDIKYDNPPIFGRGDVIINWENEVLLGEIKTMPSEGFEYRKMHKKGKTGHIEQLLIYMKILEQDFAVLIYENKNNHELLIIPVDMNEINKKWVDYSFDWMTIVRKSWEDRQLPKKNYRANSKICKGCPLVKMCNEAGVGSVKIESLEELSETM